MKLGFLVVHYMLRPADAGGLAKCDYLLTNANGARSGVLEAAPASARVAFHLGGLMMVNPTWDGERFAPWYARTAAGVPCENGGEPNARYVYVDFREEAFIRERVNQWLEILAAPNLARVADVFSDGHSPYGTPPPAPFGWTGYAVPRIEPEPFSWATPGRAAFEGWAAAALALARSFLAPAGKGIVPNSDLCIPYLMAAGGVACESFGHPQRAPDNWRLSPARWADQVSALAVPSGKPTLLICETEGLGDLATVREFALATALLGAAANNQVFFGFNGGWATSQRYLWYPREYEAALALGAPTEKRVALEGTGPGPACVWRRRFKNGTVLVNPTGRRINGTFATAGKPWGEGARRAITTIGPGQGIVVLNDAA